VDLRQVEIYMYPFLVFKADELGSYFFLIEEGKLFLMQFTALSKSGRLVEGIIVTQVIFLKNTVHQLTAFAAKIMVSQSYFISATGFATMVAEERCLNGIRHKAAKIKLMPARGYERVQSGY